MANEEHLAILRQGVDVWNEWREKNTEVVPDLVGADLAGMKLERANLAGVKLERANFAGVDLGRHFVSARNMDRERGIIEGAERSWNYNFETRSDPKSESLEGMAHLRVSDISSGLRRKQENSKGVGLTKPDRKLTTGTWWSDLPTRLTGVSLAGADLSRANFERVELTGANFTGANLERANLTLADITGADFENTLFGLTILAGTDLSEARGLESCLHTGPSFIDHQTIRRSDRLPDAFLRGCGLPDQLIDHLPSLLNDPIQFYSCFISYSAKNDDFARRLHADLQDSGVRCWFAPEDLKTGDLLHKAIFDAIQDRDKLLLILSETSVASAWVTREVETALEEEVKHDKTVLFPLRLDDAVFNTTDQWAHDIRRNRHIGDFKNWKDHDEYRRGLERLLRDLKVGM